jgi:hypothetical protein
MRDSYDQTEQGFADWQATGDTSTYDWGDHLDIVRAAVACGVTFRRVRVVSEPLSEYMRWEHACTGTNVQAGADVRWLPAPTPPTRCCPAPGDAPVRRGTHQLRPRSIEGTRRVRGTSQVFCALNSRYASW